MSRRHCGCRFWRVGWFVAFWPCSVWLACYDENKLPEHEDFVRSCREHMPLRGAKRA